MADTQHNVDHSDVEQFFDFEYYYEGSCDEASKKSESVPTGTVPFDHNGEHQFYSANFSTFDNDPMQMVSVGTELHSGVAFTDTSNSGYANLSNNPFEGSSHLKTLEHFDHADTGPSNLSSLHQIDNLPAGPPNYGPNNFHGLQGSLSALDTDHTIMQSSSTSLQRGPSLNTDLLQHAPNLSSSQLEKTLYSSETSMIVRKRPATPQPTDAQLSALQIQLAKKTGVPEISLGVMCFNPKSQPKRRRTSSQKRSKKDVEDAGGSCFLCLVIKKKCSGQRPCDTCRDYWQKRVHNSTSFMWTCDVQSKLTDFSSSLGVSESEVFSAFDSQFGGTYDFLQKFVYLFDFMRFFEQYRSNFFLSKSNGTRLWFYAFSHSIIRWKRVLLFLAPGLKRVLDLIEKLHKYLCLSVFEDCDQLHGHTNKFEAVMVCVTIFDEIKHHQFEHHQMSMEILDSSARDHVQLLLKSRLKVFCSRVYDFDESKLNLSKIDKSEANIKVAMVIARVPELSSCLPRRYQDPVWYWDAEFRRLLSIKKPSTAQLPACLLPRLDISDYHDSCCCGRASDSAPPGFLSLFGHSARSFADFVHSGPQKISLREVEKDFDARQALNDVFGGQGIDSSSLNKRMIVFEKALYFSLQQVFGIIYVWTQHREIDLEKMFSTNKIDPAVEYFRSRVFVCILHWAVNMYHEIWSSVKMPKTSAEPSLELPGPDMLPTDQLNGFRIDYSSGTRQVFEDFLEMAKSDELGLSSTEDGSSDELSEISDDADMTSDGSSTSDSFP